jgi:hypothetical protein
VVDAQVGREVVVFGDKVGYRKLLVPHLLRVSCSICWTLVSVMIE